MMRPVSSSAGSVQDTVPNAPAPAECPRTAPAVRRNRIENNRRRYSRSRSLASLLRGAAEQIAHVVAGHHRDGTRAKADDDRTVRRRSPASARSGDSPSPCSTGRRNPRNRWLHQPSPSCRDPGWRPVATPSMAARCSACRSFPVDRKSGSARTRRTTCRRRSRQRVRRHQVRCPHCRPNGNLAENPTPPRRAWGCNWPASRALPCPARPRPFPGRRSRARRCVSTGAGRPAGTSARRR